MHKLSLLPVLGALFFLLALFQNCGQFAALREDSNSESSQGVGSVVSAPDIAIGSTYDGKPYVCAITNGQLGCWGANNGGNIGNGIDTSTEPTPKLVIPSGAQSVYASPAGTTCAVVSG